MTTTVIDEMRERVEVLRSKAEHRRREALGYEADAKRSHNAAAYCDQMADQYEAILSQVKPERFDALAEF